MARGAGLRLRSEIPGGQMLVILRLRPYGEEDIGHDPPPLEL